MEHPDKTGSWIPGFFVSLVSFEKVISWNTSAAVPGLSADCDGFWNLLFYAFIYWKHHTGSLVQQVIYGALAHGNRWTLPHRGQVPPGLCSITLSGSGDINNVSPLCPGCPPGFLLLFSRRLWFFLRYISCDGGSELFPLFLGVLSLLTSAWSIWTWAVKASSLIKRSYTKSTSCSLLSFLNSSLETITPLLCPKIGTVNTNMQIFWQLFINT